MRGKLVVLAVLVLVVRAGAGVATAGDLKPATKMTDDLAALHQQALAASAARVPLDTADPTLPVADDLVTIDATAADDPNVLAADLHALGALDVAVAGLRVSARLPVAALPALEMLASLRFAWPAYSATNIGAVTSQGDVAMRASIARNRFGLDGTGVMVGVLSDSFGCLPGGVANGTTSGDLPTVMVVSDLGGAACNAATDEGRAMLEIVHDVAPGAPLAFATAFLGQASFANNIRNLRNFGAKVIVDDVSYLTAPMFQDGIIAQAVNDVAASGVAYFSSAGNTARQAFDSVFVPGTVYAAADPRLGSNPVFLGGTAHDFGGTPFQAFTVRVGTSFTMSLQWDSPFASVSGVGTTTDVDVYVLNSARTQVLLAATTNNIVAGDPVEVLRVSCGGPGDCALAFLIVKHSGPNPGRFKYVLFQSVGNVTTTPGLTSGTIVGHANALGAIAVGAAYYLQTPAFGAPTPVLEFFSSSGTTPILFGPTGNRLATPDPRASKPEIVAPDGANTTFFGIDSEGDGRPNFFGTSAAAPHAAGVGALMRQAVPTLTPAQMRTALQNTAVNMGAPGFDNDTGSGLIQADAALVAAGAKEVTTTTLISSVNPAVAGQPVTFTARVSVPIPGAVTPTGMVTFFDNAINLGTAVLDIGGSASFTTSVLTAGVHGITAQYGGDARSGPSTGSLSQTIGKANTTTVVASSANPAIFGQALTFTATVSSVAPSTRIPTGSVAFLHGPLGLGSVPLSATGQATLTTSALLVGSSHPIAAVYAGDASENSSTSPLLTQAIVPAVSSTVVTASPSPTFGGVTLTATVTLAGPSSETPTGLVTFIVDGAPLGAIPLNATGQATLTTSTLAAGSRTILASYGGDANVLPSTSSALTLPVAKAATTTTLTSSVNPSVTGQQVTLMATVGLVAPSVGLPTGAVIFRDGTTVLGTVPLTPAGGIAMASLPAALAVGTHSLTASFGGDANTSASTSAARMQTVAKAATSIALTTSTNTAVIGQMVTFTATLGVVAPGVGSPTGSVMFFNGATALGTATPDAIGVATLVTNAMTVGPHSITARYGGDTSFTASMSSTLTVTTVKAATATIVTASANPVSWHQPVTLTAAVAVIAPGTGTPTGMVTFFDGPTALGTAMLNAMGRATLTTSTLTLGDHPITASYGGAPSFDGSVSPVLTETILRAPSATTLTASPNPAVTGRPVVLTATVAMVTPGAVTPTGSVTFFDGAAPLGTVPLAAGRAMLTSNALAVGAHALTASYSGDGTIAPSISAVVTETINRAPTTTALTSSTYPSVTGRPVTFTAKVSVVAPGTGTPTGSVTFMDGATPLATVALDATRQATLTTSSLAVGAHAITVVYGGDAGFATSKSPVLTETIGKAATKTTVTSSASPVIHGVPITFTATVTVVAPGAGTPTGTVTFLDGVTVLGTATLDAAGQASLTTSALVAGTRSITARYAGDASFTTSTSPARIETVTKASTLLALATSASSAVLGQPVVLTATVNVIAPGAGIPTGGVTFLNGAVALGTAPLNAAGQATVTTRALTLGLHTIGARYVGDASFTTSSASTLPVTIAKAATTTTVTSSANPAALRQPVTLTATVVVVAPGAGAPTGTVTFFNGPTALGTGALGTTGRATLTTSALTLGDHAITASYGGAASLNGSVSTVLTETITPAASATALTALPNPSITGRLVTLTATVSVVAPGAGTPTGTVTFLDGASPLGTGTLNVARQATLKTSALAAGTHALTASYAGDGNVAPSTSSAVTETIKVGSTTTVLTAAPNPVIVGLPVTFTATVNPVAPAVGVPTGVVTFMEGAVALGMAPLNNARQATLTTSVLALGSHPIVARYGGDGSFAPSASPLLTEKINNQPPAITSVNTVTFTPGKAGQTFTVTTTGIPTNTITRTGTLPTGVTFTDNHDNTATIAGTPAAGTQVRSPYAWVITAGNGMPPNAVQNPFSFKVICPTITVNGTIPALTFNIAMPTAAFTQAGGNGTITWSATGLPTGTTINAASGQVTGTPTATGTFAATITATDAGACTGSAPLSVTVAPVVQGVTYTGLVDNTQFVITGGTTASPTTPFVGDTGRLGGNALPSAGVKALAGTFPTPAGGSVTIAADGTFIYTPKANPGAAATTSDSFTYTVVSNTGGGAPVASAPATATLTGAGRVWYVKNNGAAGNGQSQSPFSTLASAVAASTTSDTIFVYRGSGTTANLATASILKTGQRLIGEGAALVVKGQQLVAAGGFPLLGNTVTLADAVSIAGIDLSAGAANGLVGTAVSNLSVAIRDLTTTTGTAVTITGAGNSGTLSFRKISATGGTNGIVLQNLIGSFTVDGDGANTAVGGNASGGTISNMTGADSITQAAPFAGVGVYLNNVQNVTLRRVTISGTNQNYGIRGFAVNGFTLEYSTVGGTNGTAATLGSPEEAGEGSVYFGNSTTNGLTTSGTFTNNVIQGGRARNLSIANTAAGLTTLMMKGNTFGLNQNFADADQSVSVEALGGGASISAIVGGTDAGAANTFAGAPGDVANFTGQAGTVMDVVFQRNAVSNTHAQNVFGGGGMTLATDGAMTFDVDGNSFRGADGSALTLFKATSGSMLRGVVNNNTIGVSGVADSGSKSGNGIFVAAGGTGTLGLTITNNTIVQYSTAGIYADNTDGSYAANFTITGNTTAQPSPEAFAGLLLTNGSPGSGDTVNVCAKITGNNFSGGDPANTSDVFITASGAGAGHTFNLPGYVGTTLANVAGFIGGNNPPSATVMVQTDAPVTAAAFTGTGTACPTP